MTRKTTQDFHPEVLRLFDRYVHGQLDRRGFLQAAAGFAAGASGAAGLLAALSPQFVQARQVEPDDPRLLGHRAEERHRRRGLDQHDAIQQQARQGQHLLAHPQL